ncbi:hypothetical protein EXIGLDRAFT_782727 [Exidia glandulosa HHB12029]|uniref:Restriction of telomere capping protein 4 n=1 Tax=Exidia glandulosa HHB12029 TaxID=1314781 RepID=A0A165Z436_EXIGL|nr:hypothetical protein EXIGLDRAFT_782727 [Exidia glandulosa HHB12029]
MPLNNVHFHPSHPVNRVTVTNWSCPKCSGPLESQLSYGSKAPSLQGKAYHFCKKERDADCKGIRVYTIPVQDDVPPYHHPYYAAYPFAPPPHGVPYAGPVWPPYPHVHPPAQAPQGHYPPPPPFRPPAAQAPAPPTASQQPLPAHANGPTGRLDCRGRNCAALPEPCAGNRLCTLKMCRQDCLAQLNAYEVARIAHEGCKPHKRDAYSPSRASHAPAQDAVDHAIPIDPALLQGSPAQSSPRLPEPSPPANPVPTVPAPATPSQPSAPVPVALVPGIGRPLAQSWASVNRAQVVQRAVRGAGGRAVSTIITLVMWAIDNQPAKHVKVAVASLAEFCLATDAASYLEVKGIDADWFELYNTGTGTWEMIERVARFPVAASSFLLYRVHGVTNCPEFAQVLGCAQEAAVASSSHRSVWSTPSRVKRLGEPVVSPLRPKRARTPSPPHPRKVPRVSSSSRPVTNVIDLSSSDSSPSDGEEEYAAPVDPDPGSLPFSIDRPGQAFPADFYFCDVVNSIALSKSVASARKRAPQDGRATLRYLVLGELLSTNVPPSTLGHIDKRLRLLKAEHPDLYREFMDYGQHEEGRYREYLKRCKPPRSTQTRSTKARAKRVTAKLEPSDDPMPIPTFSGSGSHDSPIVLDTDDQHDSQVLPSQPTPLSPLSAQLESLSQQYAPRDRTPPIPIEKIPVTIDWDRVMGRATGFLVILEEIVADPLGHPYTERLCAAIRAHRDKTASVTQIALVLESLNPHGGYYGPEGLDLAQTMCSVFAQAFPTNARRAILPLKPHEYADRVLARELILLLVRDDFDLDDLTAEQLYESTKYFGQEHQPLPDDEKGGLERETAGQRYSDKFQTALAASGQLGTSS